MIKNKRDSFIYIMIIFALLAAIKSIFTDTGFDNAYTIAMSYRHLNGDRMFYTMWEPHQTSIFVCDILMLIYKAFIPSLFGVHIYLQICGTIVLGILSLFLYRFLKTYVDKNYAALGSIFFFIFRVKQSPFLDYANLQIVFSVALFIALVKFLNSQEKIYYLLLCSIFICLMVLSYPSCVLHFFCVEILLIIYSEKKKRNSLLLLLFCSFFGLIYLSYFCIRIGFNSLFETFKNIIFSDTHQTGETFVSSYYNGIISSLVWIVLSFVLALIIVFLVKKIRKKEINLFTILGINILISEIAMLVLQKKTGIDWSCSIYILPIFLILFAIINCFGVKGELIKQVWIIGISISLSSFFATSILSDLGIISNLSYLVLGGVVSIIPLYRSKEKMFGFLLCIVAVATIHRGLVVWGYPNLQGINMVYDVQTIIRSGPSFGIVCDDDTCRRIIYDSEDHKKFIKQDDTVLLLGRWIIDPVEYLVIGGEISNNSVIDIPLYNDMTLKYFDYHPEKKPSIIAISGWNGSIEISLSDNIVKWIDENYSFIGNGRYWLYYGEKNK